MVSIHGFHRLPYRVTTKAGVERATFADLDEARWYARLSSVAAGLLLVWRTAPVLRRRPLAGFDRAVEVREVGA